MRVFHDIAAVNQATPTVVAIGNFDGVHLGHQALILRCVRLAKERNLPPSVLTFFPHPSEVLCPGKHMRRLTLTSEKLKLLEELGVDMVLAEQFTLDLAQLSPREFFEQYLLGLKAERIHVGNDFRFGHNRQGTTATLASLSKAHGIEIEVQSEVTYCGSRISSSAIRDRIGRGEMNEANALLGRPYFLMGTVIRGDGRGKELGFPTANLTVAPEKIFPPYGVYVARVSWRDRRHRAITNIGVRPTFGALPTPLIEVHLFDFDRDLYGECIRIEVFERVRAEMSFPSRQALVTQIRRDCLVARASRSLD